MTLSRLPLSKLRLVALAGAAVLASAGGGAKAAPEDATDPFRAEIPLSMNELLEARGGYSAGGFTFNFGLTATILSASTDGQFEKVELLGEDGLLRRNGLNDGVSELTAQLSDGLSNVSLTDSGLTIVFNNTMDGRIIAQSIDLDVFIENYDSAVGLATTAASATRAATDAVMLGGLK